VVKVSLKAVQCSQINKNKKIIIKKKRKSGRRWIFWLTERTNNNNKKKGFSFFVVVFGSYFLVGWLVGLFACLFVCLFVWFCRRSVAPEMPTRTKRTAQAAAKYDASAG